MAAEIVFYSGRCKEDVMEEKSRGEEEGEAGEMRCREERDNRAAGDKQQRVPPLPPLPELQPWSWSWRVAGKDRGAHLCQGEAGASGALREGRLGPGKAWGIEVQHSWWGPQAGGPGLLRGLGGGGGGDEDDPGRRWWGPYPWGPRRWSVPPPPGARSLEVPG